MFAGPELVRLIAEFEATMDGKCVTATRVTRHHEQSGTIQRKFLHDVLAAVIEKLGNSFMEDREDLKLDTGDIFDPTVVTMMRQDEVTGQQQYQIVQKERLVKRTKKLMEPINKNQLSLFSQPTPKSKAKSQMSSLKSDCSLFARMYITCQTRERNLVEFFSHENQACPPSLGPTQSDLVECLERCAESSEKGSGH